MDVSSLEIVYTSNGKTVTIPTDNFDKGLVYPPRTVVHLLHQFEDIVTEYFISETSDQDSILDILEMMKEIGINYIGCTKYNEVLTTNNVKSYLLCNPFLHYEI